jgi:hypothetical protein
MQRLTFAIVSLGLVSLLLAADASNPGPGSPGSPGSPGVNLLKNGELTGLSNGALPGWTLYAEGQDVSIDDQDHPEGVASSLKIHVKNAGENQGSISQKLKDLPANAKLVFTAWAKCTSADVAFLQVKGKAAKKEVFRKDSEAVAPGSWQELRLEIDTGSATEISVQCRFRQGDQGVGDTVWFANAKLIKAD